MRDNGAFSPLGAALGALSFDHTHPKFILIDQAKEAYIDLLCQ